MVKGAKAALIPFSKENPGIITLPPEEIKIPGRHNLENSLAAAQAAYLCGVKKETAAAVLKTFPGVEHRIECVATINGVGFYNDSKGTNPDSTLAALETFAGRGIILILGGRDKGVSLDGLIRKVKEGVKGVVLIGEAAARFGKALKEADFNSIYHSNSMEEAVRKAYSLAGPEDVVLLSPACASFDMFTDYEERGRVFKQLCKNLK
ncbi:UDP-N-acetylmuramoyl-L-alanine--D-glutamate ligase, partial [Candidatus Saganbacteria bacterium]|nr:UDP-N-acetylmuramoyl-L-alanine--D-glutamate ligase [Candidatus Saganbacteria bacterium]